MSRYIIFIHWVKLHRIRILHGQGGVDNSKCVGDLWSLLYWAIIRKVANLLYVQYWNHYGHIVRSTR